MRPGVLLDSAVLDSIYGTVENFDRWPSALSAVAADSDAVGGLLMILLSSSERIAISSPALQAAADEYMEQWAARDIRTNRLIERQLELTHDTIVDDDVITDEEAASDPFYTDFLAKHDLRYFCASFISPQVGMGVGLSLQRSHKQGAFDEAARMRVLAYSRHIERALHLHDRLSEYETARATLEAVISRHRQMVLLVDAEGDVLLDNAAAPDLLHRFVISSGGKNRLNTAALPLDVMCAVANAARGETAGPHNAFIAAESGKAGIAVTVLPAPPLRKADLRSATAPRVGRAIITFAEAGQARSYDPAIARDFLKVTLGEARVAALIASGDSPRTAADKLGLTEQTVRFVLGQVYQKTGLKRQNELAAALARLSFAPAHQF